MKAELQRIAVRAAAIERRKVAAAEIERIRAAHPNPLVRRALWRAIHYVSYIPPAKPATRKRSYAEKDKAFKSTNAVTKRAAGNAWQRWTSAHDEIVMLAAAPDVDLAKSIGRSLKAVRERRKVLRKERQ